MNQDQEHIPQAFLLHSVSKRNHTTLGSFLREQCILICRYVVGEDGLKQLQTVRLDDESVLIPEVNTLCGSSSEIEGVLEGDGDEN